jgi:hypothetical protein
MLLHSIWDFWRWAFARTYLRDRRRWGESPHVGGHEARRVPLWSAITGLSISMSFNLLALGAAVAWALRLPAHATHPRELGLGLMVLALGANYLRFARFGDADALIEQLGSASSDATRRDERKLFGYTLASFLAPVLIVVVRLFLR